MREGEEGEEGGKRKKGRGRRRGRRVSGMREKEGGRRNMETEPNLVQCCISLHWTPQQTDNL